MPDGQTLRQAAAQASTPAERLRPPFRPEPDDWAHPLAQSRLDVWRQHVSKGSEDGFLRVLGWRGLSLPNVAIGLAPARLPPNAPRPDWVAACLRMVLLAARTDVPPAPIFLDPRREAQPEAFFVSLVEAASSGPKALLPGLGAQPELLVPLQRRLLGQLTDLARGALSEVGSPGLPWPVLLAYPVLARKITTLWDHWITATEELLRRLGDDRAALAGLLSGHDPGPPETVEIGDADGHDGGRLVVIVGFADGFRVVYKARDLALDRAFAGLVDVLCSQGLDLAGSVPRVLLRPGYGWAEFVPHRHARDAAGLKHFWRQAGQLMGVLNALGGGDMHAGNVIAAGEHLAFIDLETVLRPLVIPPPGLRQVEGSAVARLSALLTASPLGTAMLPAMLHGGDQRYRDLGGLSAPGQGPHRAGPGPVEAELLAHAADLEAGFVQALRQLRRVAPQLLSPGGPLEGFAGVPLRLVFRDTSLYTRVLRLSLQPAMLRDGAEHDLALERLSRMLTPHAEAPAFAAVVHAEKRAMAMLDIPRFEMAADGRDLRDAQGLVARAAAQRDALGIARERLEALREEDEPWQRRILAMSIQARVIGHGSQPAAEAAEPAPAEPLAAARAIGNTLAEQAIEGAAGDLAWLCPTHHPDPGFVAFTGLDTGLGEGMLGIGLFLAALARVSGDAEVLRLRDGALLALRPPECRPTDYVSLAATPLGLLDGLAGRCWGLTAIARLGGPDWCLEAAEEAWSAAAVQPSGASWRVADGACGLLLAGLALRTAAPERVTEAALAGLARRASGLVNAALPWAEPGLALGLAGAGRSLAQAAMQLGLKDVAQAARAVLLSPWSRAGGTGWGRGAAGRILALRAAMTWLGRDAELADRMATEIDWLRAAPTPGWDALWSGAAGLLEADPSRARLSDLARRALDGRLQPVAPVVRGALFPGLGHGLAGIGYVLLRQADPSIPDLLGFGS